MKISLTSFMDFIATPGTARPAFVSAIKHRSAYYPAIDYWRQLRDAIVDFHQNNVRDKKELNDVLNIVDSTKRDNYENAIKQYKSFLGRKTISWFQPPEASDWQHKDLFVRINPELGLDIDGTKYIIKLYFRNDTIIKETIAPVLTLMGQTLGRTGAMAILDVQRKRLFTDETPLQDLTDVLEAEADYFMKMWKSTP